MLDKLTERVAWAIKIIKEEKSLDKDITDVDLAKILGTNKDTLAGYRNQKGLLKSEVVENLVSHYKFNPLWLFKGQGEPFPGARNKYPEVCGPEPSLKADIYNKDTNLRVPAGNELYAPYTPANGHERSTDPALQAMSDIKDIFTSGDPVLIPAIQWNIAAFKRALMRERQVAQLIQENNDLRARIGKLENLCNEFKAEVEELKKKIRYLTDISEGSSAGGI